MQLIAVTALGAFLLVGLFVGTWLVRLSLRTGQQPELLVGVSILGLGPLGFAPIVIALAFLDVSPAAATSLVAIGSAAMATGGACAAWFTVCVFHPSSPTAQRIGGTMVAGCLLLWATSGAGGGFDLREGVSLPGQLNILLRAAILGWSSAESFRHWARLRKRLRLGLAEPVLTNRFALWGTATGGAAIGNLIAFASAMIDIRALAAGDLLNLTISLIGFIATPCMFLAFSPPKAYRRYLRRREPEAQPAG